MPRDGGPCVNTLQSPVSAACHPIPRDHGYGYVGPRDRTRTVTETPGPVLIKVSVTSIAPSRHDSRLPSKHISWTVTHTGVPTGTLESHRVPWSDTTQSRCSRKNDRDKRPGESLEPLSFETGHLSLRRRGLTPTGVTRPDRPTPTHPQRQPYSPSAPTPPPRVDPTPLVSLRPERPCKGPPTTSRSQGRTPPSSTEECHRPHRVPSGHTPGVRRPLFAFPGRRDRGARPR